MLSPSFQLVYFTCHVAHRALFDSTPALSRRTFANVVTKRQAGRRGKERETISLEFIYEMSSCGGDITSQMHTLHLERPRDNLPWLLTLYLMCFTILFV